MVVPWPIGFISPSIIVLGLFVNSANYTYVFNCFFRAAGQLISFPSFPHVLQLILK